MRQGTQTREMTHRAIDRIRCKDGVADCRAVPWVEAGVLQEHRRAGDTLSLGEREHGHEQRDEQSAERVRTRRAQHLAA